MTESSYRKILWLYAVLTVAGLLSVFYPNYSEALAAAYESEPETMPSSIAGVASLGLLVIWLIGFIGLFWFKPWARQLSLFATLGSLLLIPFMGASLSSGIETALFEAATLTWGAILALSFYSSINQRFGR